MHYLNLEICQLLEKLGCTSESSFYWCRQKSQADDQVKLVFRESRKKSTADWIVDILAFTWDDICTKENAIKIWGEEGRKGICGNEFKDDDEFGRHICQFHPG